MAKKKELDKDIIIHDNMSFVKYIYHDDIIHKINDISTSINFYYKDKNPIILGVLNGSVYFMMDLLKCLDFPYEIDFVDIKSYRGMERSDIDFKHKDFSKYKDRDILVVEDIIDSGNTLSYLINHLNDNNVKNIRIVSLLKKKIEYENIFKYKIDWFGFEIKNKYVIGYGLDINNLFRFLKDIYILDEKK